MTGPYAAGEVVTLVRRQRDGQDGDGNDVWTTVETDVPGCVVWPRASSELVQAQDTVIVGLQVLLPPGTAVAAADQLLVRGDLYDVDGEPGGWSAPWAEGPGGVEVALTRATG